MQVSNMFVARFVDFSLDPPSTCSASHDQDCVFNYTRHFISIGCFYLNFKDAIKEGDGERILECWHYLLPIFRNAGRKNLL